MHFARLVQLVPYNTHFHCIFFPIDGKKEREDKRDGKVVRERIFNENAEKEKRQKFPFLMACTKVEASLKKYKRTPLCSQLFRLVQERKNVEVETLQKKVESMT